jgi:hypothetical protein
MQAANLERASGVIPADTPTATLRRAWIMLTKALIAALAAIALAVAAPAAGATIAKSRPLTTSTAAAHASSTPCVTLTRAGVISAQEEGADTDPDRGPETDPDPDVDSPIDQDPRTDTDADTGPNTGTSDPNEPDPDLGECEQ